MERWNRVCVWGVDFKIFNNQYALGFDQSDWMPATKTGYGQIDISCWISAVDEIVSFPQMVSY